MLNTFKYTKEVSISLKNVAHKKKINYSFTIGIEVFTDSCRASPSLFVINRTRGYIPNFWLIDSTFRITSSRITIYLPPIKTKKQLFVAMSCSVMSWPRSLATIRRFSALTPDPKFKVRHCSTLLGLSRDCHFKKREMKYTSMLFDVLRVKYFFYFYCSYILFICKKK